MRKLRWPALGALAAVALCAIAAATAWLLSEPVQRLDHPVADPYAEVSRCRGDVLDAAAIDANRDGTLDLAVLCDLEVIAMSGVDGDCLWRHDLRLDGVPETHHRPFMAAGGRRALAFAVSDMILAADAETGETRWSRRLGARLGRIQLDDECLLATVLGADQELVALLSRSGEPTACGVRSDASGAVAPEHVLSQQHVPEAGGDVLTMTRGAVAAWSSACGLSPCQAFITPAGVLVSGNALQAEDRREPARGVARIQSLDTGRTIRVLQPSDHRWRFWSRPPYLVASRTLVRASIHVFDARSLERLWHAGSDPSPAVWRRVDP